jgi:nitrate reductase delta subunit
MSIYRVLSALLSYPSAELKAATPALRAAVASAGSLTGEAVGALLALTEEIQSDDLYALQERYVSQFDRGRALSLHLFEHVHGESRDRGQAMVDLVDVYRRHGFELAVRELPDYLPLFLEFLGHIPDHDARELLSDAMPVVTLIGARLTQRGSPYASIFAGLTAIGGRPQNEAVIRRQVSEEGPDETIVQMDRIWEEEAVTFMGNLGGGCGSADVAERPLRPMQRPSSGGDGTRTAASERIGKLKQPNTG